MIRTGVLPLRATRTAPLDWKIRFTGIDLTGATLLGEVRQNWDQPGSPAIALPVAAANTTGVRLIGTGSNGGGTYSDVGVFIEQDDLDDIPGPAAAQIEPGQDLNWKWRLWITPSGGTKAVWLEGDFKVGGSASGVGAGPFVSGATDAQFAVIDGMITITIAGSELLADYVDDLLAATDLAREWAENPEDTAITGNAGHFSALHWAAKAEGHADDASAEADRAEAAADVAAANVHYYATRAAASAALAGLANGDIIEVESDESDFDRRTRYIKTAGALGSILARLPKLVAGALPYYMPGPLTRVIDAVDPVDGQSKPHVFPHVYIDPINGNDSWDGLYGYSQGDGVGGPIKTRTAFEAHKHFRNGVTVGVCDSGRDLPFSLDYAEPNASANGSHTLSQFSVVPYGNGGKLCKLKGTDPIPAASIHAHPTISGAFEITAWAHGLWSTSAAIRMLQKQYNGELEPLHRKQNESDVTSAGKYWYDSNITGTTERLVFFPWGGVNAATAPDGTFEATTRMYALSGRDDCLFHGFWGFAHGCNNGSFFTYARPVVSRCLAELGGKHCWVLGAGRITDVFSINGTAGVDYWPEGGPTIMQTVFEGDLTDKVAVLTRCAAICDDTLYLHAASGKDACQALYSHAATGGLATRLTQIDCWNANTATGQSQTIFATWEISGHFSAGFNGNNTGIVSVPGAHVVIRDSLCLNSRREFTTSGSSPSFFDIDGLICIPGTGISIASIALNSIDSLSMRNTLLHADPPTYSPLVSLWPGATSSIDIQNCILSNTLIAYDFGTGSTDPAFARFDNNYYDLIVDPPGTSDPYVARWKNHYYKLPPYGGSADKEFAADWQGVLGFDTHSGADQYGPTISDDTVGWIGATPTSAHPENAVLDPSSPMAGKITLLPPEKMLEMMARPQTRAAAIDYLENDAPRLLVYVR